ncbi:MAG TPA: PKD domain-containing protein [Candidatus Limnocylindrales bacterium]|nr:PKD domain-containing protein [Candidatus Limnocylindrales bacterium]
MPGNSLPSRLERRRSRGQSLVEFALIVPALMLLLMFAIDFGRVYLGWVNLQNLTRIAANFAANNADGFSPIDPTVQSRYRTLVANDAKAINCTLPNPIPDPVFASGNDIGDLAQVHIDCRFGIITPIISSILGGDVLVSAESSFPVKAGIVGTVPGGGGGGPVAAPVADLVGSPASGYSPLLVQFTDTSTNFPTSWVWSFGDGGTSFVQNPTHTYAAAGTFTVTLTASNTGGVDSRTRSAYIVVVDPPTTGPIPEFTATPRSGQVPPSLNVAFTDTSTGGPTTWLWTFGDGGTSTSQNPTHTYSTAGSYDVSLTVSDGTTSNTQTKVGYIVLVDRPCIVPNFAGTKRNNAQSNWAAAGFTTTVTYRAGNGNYTINYQSLPGGQVNPPGGCGAAIQVGP